MINTQIQLLSLDISSNIIDIRHFNIEKNPIVTSSDISDLIADDDHIGMIMTGFPEEDKKYALQISAKRAYIEVPWTDSVISGAYYDKQNKQLIFNYCLEKPTELIQQICVDMTDMINTYDGDNETISCTSDNKFCVLTSSLSSSYATSASIAYSVICAASDICSYLSLGNLASKNESELSLDCYALSNDVSSKNELYLAFNKLSNYDNWDKAHEYVNRLTCTIFTYKTIDNIISTLSIASYIK